MVTWIKENLGSDLETVRVNNKRIFKDPLKSDVTVLAQQPGIGKTKTIIDFLKDTELKCAVIVPYHKLVKSEYTKLNNIVHWQGFKYKCKKFTQLKKKYSDILEKLPKKSFLCPRECGSAMESCAYHSQFNEVKQHLITVPEYLNSNNFKNFDLIILDESIGRGEDLKLDIENLNKFFKLIDEEGYGGHLNFQPDNILDILTDEEIYDCLHKEVSEIVNYNLKGKLVDNIEKLESVYSVNLYQLKLWYHYDRIYNLGFDMVYFKPYIYDILNKDIPVVISDATFDKSFFNALYQQYCQEHREKDLNIKVYYSALKSPNTKIIKLYKNNMFYKSGMGIATTKKKKSYITNKDNPDIIKLVKALESISKHYYRCGLITYDVLNQYIESIIPGFEFLNIGNTLGLNTFIDKEAVIICGTHLIGDKDLLKEYNKLFRKKYDLEMDFQYNEFFYDVNFIKWKNPSGKDIIIEENIRKKPKSLSSIYEDKFSKENFGFSPRDYAIYKFESTAYQNIHRSRLLFNNMEVYVMGYVPEKLYLEAVIEELGNKSSRVYLDKKFSGTYPLRLSKRIRDYSDNHPDDDVTTIAKKFKLREGTKMNTRFVTAILDYLPPKAIRKIDEGIKKGLKSPSDFKKKYTILNRVPFQKAYDIDSFLDDCIKYSEIL